MMKMGQPKFAVLPPVYEGSPLVRLHIQPGAFHRFRPSRTLAKIAVLRHFPHGVGLII